jgi:membrane associated rhomboid family serine protease
MNRIWRRPFRWTYTNAAITLIGINVVVFILKFAAGSMIFEFGAAGDGMGRVRVSLANLLALNPILVSKYKMYWQFVTYMFSHAGITHILFNMLALFIFGRQLEYRMGSREFILYYMVTGTLAGVLSFALYMLTGAYNVSLLGASGAIFAVQLAYAAFFPDAVIYIWGIIPLRAPVMVIVFTALELFSGLSGIGNTAHFTHLFGFVAGFFYSLVRWGENPIRMMFGRRWR